jgi:hypothetical protein
MPDSDPNEKITIKVPKDNHKSDSVIRGSVNGQPYKVAVDQEVEVPAAVAEAIMNSGIIFEVVGGSGAGLPDLPTAPLTDTATRLEPAEDPTKPDGEDAPPVATVEGGDGDTGVGGSAAMDVGTEPDFNEAMTNAEGQGVAAQGGERVGNDVTENASSDADDIKGDNQPPATDTATAEDGNSGDDPTAAEEPAADEGEQQEPEQQEQTETVGALKDRIATVDDVEALKAERDAEVAGKDRSTAVAAYDARIDALSQQG